MRITLIAPLVAATAIAALPATARADRSDCPRKLERAYSKHYRQVAHRLGKRAPGRNIRRWGVLFKGTTFDATCGEIRRSNGQLKRLLVRPSYPTLTRQAIQPAQPPAGVASTVERAPSAPLSSIRACESGGNYATNTGNGFYGAYQFTQSTWNSVGGSGSPAAASPAEQDRRAAMLYAREGASPWPVCGR
jgi:hypothetical protein